MGLLHRFVILALCGSVFLPDTTSQGYYYENVNKYNLVNGRLQLVPPPPPPTTTTPEPTLMETIFPWMSDAYDSSKTPEEDAAILNSISDDQITSSSNVDSGSSSWFTLPGFGSLTSDSEQHEVYEQPPNYPQQGMYNMYYPNQNPMGAASQSQPMIMPGPDQQGFMPSQQGGAMAPQKGPLSSHQGHIPSSEQAPMPQQQAPMPHQPSQMPHQQASMPHQQSQMSHQQGQMPPQQLPPSGPVYPGVKAPEPEHHMQIPYTVVPNHPAMTEPESEKMHPMQSQQMPMYSPMYVSEQGKPINPYQGQQYPSYMAAQQPQSPPQAQYPYRAPIQGVPNSGKIPYNFHQQVQDSIPLPGPYGLSGFNQQMFPYPYSTNLPFDQGQGPNFPEPTEKSVSFWEMLTNYFTFGKRNDLEEMLTEDNIAVARSMVEEDEVEQTKASDGDDATDAEDESSAAEEDDDDDTSNLKEGPPAGTDSTGGKSDKDFPCPKTGIWKWNGDVCIAVGPVPVWACRPNDLIVSGKIAICRNKIYFSPQKIIQNLGTPN